MEGAHVFPVMCAFSLRLCRLFFAVHFACALTLADDGSCRSDAFLSFRTGPKRTLGPGPLRNLQAPEARSPPLDSTPQRTYLGDSAALLNGVWSNGGWNKFHLAYRLLIYRGRCRMSGTSSIVARSTPKVLFVRVSLFDFVKMKVQRVCVRFEPYISAVHLH